MTDPAAGGKTSMQSCNHAISPDILAIQHAGEQQIKLTD
jgi:hypothetical protein